MLVSRVMSSSALKPVNELSRLLILVISGCYVLGFVTVSSFLASFGILSFEVLNAQYIVAGVITIVPLSAAFLIAWEIHRYITLETIFEHKGISKRLDNYLWGNMYIWILSVSLVSVFNIGKRDLSLSAHAVDYSPLLNNYFNVIDRAVAFLLSTTPLLVFLVSSVVKIAFLGGSIFLLLTVVTYLWRKLFRRKFGDDSSKTVNKKHKEKNHGATSLFFLRLLEIFCLSVSFSLAFYVYRSIKVYFFNPAWLPDSTLTTEIMFAWFFSAVVIAYYVILNLLVPLRSCGFKKLRKIRLFPLVHSVVYFGLFLVLIALVSFGQVIYPRIPYGIGGGQPRQVRVYTDDNDRFGVNSNSEVYLLGESRNFIFLTTKDENSPIRVLQLKRDNVEAIETIIP